MNCDKNNRDEYQTEEQVTINITELKRILMSLVGTSTFCTNIQQIEHLLHLALNEL